MPKPEAMRSSCLFAHRLYGRDVSQKLLLACHHFFNIGKRFILGIHPAVQPLQRLGNAFCQLVFAHAAYFLQFGYSLCCFYPGTIGQWGTFKNAAVHNIIPLLHGIHPLVYGGYLLVQHFYLVLQLAVFYLQNPLVGTWKIFLHRQYQQHRS